ncbi:hypothetical protein GF336_07080 [Candidatus Woesearchaeota archaeon]|nr:hypothetical protein [Candidatus Woesearchaeota archaeon]
MVNRLTKKGQLTMFIILGMFILLIFGLVFYFVNQAKETALQETAEKSLSDALQTDPFKYYTSLCLKATMEEGIKIIGENGGYIYDEDYDITEEGIMYFIRSVPKVPPWYPCNNHYNPPAYCRYDLDTVALGNIHSFGNINTNTDNYKDFEEIAISDLQQYIDDNLTKCTDFDTLQAIIPSYNITAGTPSTNITIGERDITAITEYPVTFHKHGQKPITTIAEYSATSRIRLKKIFKAASNSISYDNSFPDFDIIKNSSSGYFESPKDEKIILSFRDLIPGARIYKEEKQNHDIIIINDSFSRIGAEQFAFRFARINRPPVLDYINKSDTDEYDYLARPEENITFNLKAADPDEDNIVFSVKGGWKNNKLIAGGLVTSTGYVELLRDSPGLTGDFNDGDAGIQKTNFSVSEINQGLEDYQEVRFMVCSSKKTDGVVCLEECGSSPVCNDKQQGTLLDSCSNGITADHCSDLCMEEPSDVCIHDPATSDSCNADEKCNGTEKYEYADTDDNGINDSWCLGCVYCPSARVSKNTDLDEDDKCGCYSGGRSWEEEWNIAYCDDDLDGIFEGTCQNNICVESET